MIYDDVTAPCACAAQAFPLSTAAPASLHHLAYLQGFAILINLHSIMPNLSKEERNQFLLQNLTMDIATVIDVFMVPFYSAPLYWFCCR
jgi:hypothetical protein